MRFLMLSLIAVASVCGQAELRFEVASVRPATDMFNTNSSWGADTGRVFLPYTTIGAVIRQAYGLRADQVKGPKWLDEERIEIQATAPAGSTRQQINQMMQALLIERFQMKVHREIRESPVYALMLRKGATAPEPSTADPNGDKSEKIKMDRERQTLAGGVNGPLGYIRLNSSSAGLRSEFEAVSMEGLATYLSQGVAGLPVIDKTGLRGTYRITVERSLEEMSIVSPKTSDGITPADPSGYSLRGSLQRQGLELVRERAPVEFLVIDSMERTPTPN